MSQLDRFKWFRKRRAESRMRAQRKARAERQNAELELALDDFVWDGRLPRSAYEDANGYRSALGEGFELEDGEPREDW